jgi:hypothetical protein
LKLETHVSVFVCWKSSTKTLARKGVHGPMPCQFSKPQMLHCLSQASLTIQQIALQGAALSQDPWNSWFFFNLLQSDKPARPHGKTLCTTLRNFENSRSILDLQGAYITLACSCAALACIVLC